MIVVNAGTPDPVQKALRERKAKWNKKMVTPFIDNLIHLKMLMNGKPSKFSKEKNFITNPLPADPSTILGLLAGDFTEIVNEGNAIIKDQLSYSQTRKKKQSEKQLSLPGITSSLDNELIVEGSTFVSRFLSGLKGPIFGDSIDAIKRRHRITLLKKVYEIYKLCDTFQSDIIRMDVGNIFSSNDDEGLYDAIELLMDIESKFISVIGDIKVLYRELSLKQKSAPVKDPINDEDSDKKTVVDEGSGKIPAVDKGLSQLIIESANDIVKEWAQVGSSILDIPQQSRKDLTDIIGKYSKSKDTQLKSFFANRVVLLYRNILSELNIKNKTNANSLIEYFMMSQNKTANIEQVLITKLADKKVQKLVGKLLRTFRIKKTHSNRVAAYKFASKFREELNKFMNVLEKDFQVETLINFINSSLIEPLNDMAQSVDSMLDSIKQNIENVKYDDPAREAKRVKLLNTINRRKMALVTKKLLQNNLALLNNSLSPIDLPDNVG